ncbi:MAG: MtrB/PioB family outer membrane beta-barrel protein, partial [Planctomycetes bacterium]|nr:MtrB/PioB family outer membrane beta-barrel protein [Planctomycetota bacterium]
FVNAWDLESDSWSVGFGAGGGVTLRPGLSLEVDYSLVDTREEVDYAFNSAGALAGSVSPAQAGTSFPDLRTQDQILETSLRWARSSRWGRSSSACMASACSSGRASSSPSRTSNAPSMKAGGNGTRRSGSSPLGRLTT